VPLAPVAYSVSGEVLGPGGYAVLLPLAEWARVPRVDGVRELLVLADHYSVTPLLLIAPVLLIAAELILITKPGRTKSTSAGSA